jgi:hypothetical protein
MLSHNASEKSLPALLPSVSMQDSDRNQRGGNPYAAMQIRRAESTGYGVNFFEK